MARALYAWNESVGAAPGDLNFEVDDEIEVISDAPGDGWMTGATADAQGMFPSNYVEELASAEPEQEGVSMEELVKKQVAEQLALATASGPEEMPAAGDDDASKTPTRSCAECGKGLICFDSSHPQFEALGGWTDPDWSCDVCQRDFVFGDMACYACESFDRCDWAACGDCVQTGSEKINKT